MKRRLEKSRSADVVISRLIMTNLPATDAGASMFSGHGASTAVACAPVRALVWHGPRQLAVESVAEPRPGDGEVLVRRRRWESVVPKWRATLAAWRTAYHPSSWAMS